MTSQCACGRFSKSRGLSASVSFLPFALPSSFNRSIYRPVILCPKPHRNACYAGFSVIDRSDTLGYRLVCHFIVLNTFWRHLWPITEQTLGNMESLCHCRCGLLIFQLQMKGKRMNSQTSKKSKRKCSRRNVQLGVQGTSVYDDASFENQNI